MTKIRPTVEELEMRIILLEKQADAMHQTIVRQADLLKDLVFMLKDLQAIAENKHLVSEEVL